MRPPNLAEVPPSPEYPKAPPVFLNGSGQAEGAPDVPKAPPVFLTGSGQAEGAPPKAAPVLLRSAPDEPVFRPPVAGPPKPPPVSLRSPGKAET